VGKGTHSNTTTPSNTTCTHGALSVRAHVRERVSDHALEGVVAHGQPEVGLEPPCGELGGEVVDEHPAGVPNRLPSDVPHGGRGQGRLEGHHPPRWVPVKEGARQHDPRRGCGALQTTTTTTTTTTTKTQPYSSQGPGMVTLHPPCSPTQWGHEHSNHAPPPQPGTG
jgi:hypothetical protein